MKQLIELYNDIIENGVVKKDRTGTGVKSVFGRQLRFNLEDGFPLMTTRKMFLKGIIHELLWFLKGDSNINYLKDNGVHIWDEWATEEGSIGPMYPTVWTNWKDNKGETHNQIANLIRNLKERHFSRRLIVSAWNVPDLPDENLSPQENVKLGKMALAPCHCLFQFYTEPVVIAGENKLRLSCMLTQRSADVLVGSCFNVPSYCLLLMMVAQCVDMIPGDFIYSIGDAHIYSNQEKIYLEEQQNNPCLPLPTLKIETDNKDIFGFKFEDFKLINYKSAGKVNYPVAV